jgi:hypothetical protein
MVETVSKAHERFPRFSRRVVLQLYILQASSTSAGPPILYERIRPAHSAPPSHKPLNSLVILFLEHLVLKNN